MRNLRKRTLKPKLVKIGGEPVFGCRACSSCYRNKDNRCVVNDDRMNEWYAKMLEADAIILGQPNVFCRCKYRDEGADRSLRICRQGVRTAFQRKIGVAVSAVRRAGAMHALGLDESLFSYKQYDSARLNIFLPRHGPKEGRSAAWTVKA